MCFLNSDCKKSDMVLVRVDGLSHTVICPFQWTKETGWICCHALAVIYGTTSAWTKIMSNDDPMWYTLLYHVTFLQKMYGPIPVLCTTSDQMEAKPVFPEQCHRKRGARKKTDTVDSCLSPQLEPNLTLHTNC